MNGIMIPGLLVCVVRVALCAVMGVMAETVARRMKDSIPIRVLCRLCIVAYALILAASFAPMEESLPAVVRRALPLLFLIPNLPVWISMLSSRPAPGDRL